jgi:pimeloyl-ACP methyl ester carboxylesterase
MRSSSQGQGGPISARLNGTNLAIAFSLLLVTFSAPWAGAGSVAEPSASGQSNAVTAHRPVLEDCVLDRQFRNLPGAVECSWYPVPEDRANPDGRWLRLRVVRVRSLAPSPARDAIVRLVGGPGQGAASLGAALAAGHRARFPNRDLVLIDQRGTGESNGLFCSTDRALTMSVADMMADVFPVAALRECRADLASRADLSTYVTDVVADDLDEVLTWLTYERVTLVAGSYGTRVAQVFMRRYPDRVRAAVLDGVVPMDARSPITYSATATDAMNDLVDACLADRACEQAFPDLRLKTDALWRRLDTGAISTEAVDPRTGHTVDVRVPKHVVGYAVRGILYEPRLFVGLPAMLDATNQGGLGPFVEAYIRRKVGFSGSAFATGLYFSVFCSEDVPFIPQDAGHSGRGVMGAALVSNFQDVCDGWPRADLPANWHDPVSTDHPVLLLSGEFDPVTTSDMGDAVALGFPNGLHLVVPGAGHGSSSNPVAASCSTQIIGDFVRAGSTRGLDVSCLARVDRLPFRVVGNR